MSEYVEWGSLAQVVVVGLIVGAGLPALFALGVRAVASKNARDESGRVPTSRRVLAGIAFGVVLLSIVFAVAFIAGGGH